MASSTFTNVPSNNVYSSFPNPNNPNNIPAAYSYTTNVPLQGQNPNNLNTNVCSVRFFIPQNLGASVFLYYRLTNFYQNHRQYVKSLDTNQLSGQAVSAGTLESGNCVPIATLSTNSSVAIYPCGLIANSLFNDTFSDPYVVPYNGETIGQNYSFTDQGIAWSSDQQKYGSNGYSDLTEIAPPPNWVSRYPNGRYTDAYPPPNLPTDYAFQVWMRIAGLPNFRKLYGRNDNDVMQRGYYQIDIEDSKSCPVLYESCLTGQNCNTLFRARLRRNTIWGNKGYCHIDCIVPWRQESIPWHCLHCCWLCLLCSRRWLYC